MLDSQAVIARLVPVTIALALAIAVTLTALAIFILAYRRLLANARLYRRLYSDAQGRDLQALFASIDQRLTHSETDLADLRRSRQDILESLGRCFQGIGMVRFNAFEGVGSDLSFSFALIDGHRDGVVLSSLFGRDESRIYAKPIKDGQSTYQLTGEEKDAVRQALTQRQERPGT
ncbi:MAG TPA: DUF4446 family protein [Bacillota bacterium]|jgi:hypothetical protein